MDDLTSQWGLGYLQPFLDFGFAASFFAVVVACVTVGARIPVWHGQRGGSASLVRGRAPHTPHPSACHLTWSPHWSPTHRRRPRRRDQTSPATTYIDTIGVFGYMLAYALVCIGAPLFLRDESPAKG